MLLEREANKLFHDIFVQVQSMKEFRCADFTALYLIFL